MSLTWALTLRLELPCTAKNVSSSILLLPPVKPSLTITWVALGPRPLITVLQRNLSEPSNSYFPALSKLRINSSALLRLAVIFLMLSTYGLGQVLILISSVRARELLASSTIAMSTNMYFIFLIMNYCFCKNSKNIFYFDFFRPRKINKRCFLF